MDAEKIFLEYADRFNQDNGKISLKTYHTLQTAKVMDQLTKMLDLSDKTRELAHITAVFHDIGRFEQVRQYNTFSDETSVDHALIGCNVLKEENLLFELSNEDRDKVITAIWTHNKYVIGDGLDEETLLLCKLIRDADKIDILRVFATEDTFDTMGETRDQVASEVISDEVYERIMNHQEIPKSIRKTGLDRWIGFLGFFYGIAFLESLRIIKEQDYYSRQFHQTEFKLPQTRERVDEVLKDIAAFLERV